MDNELRLSLGKLFGEIYRIQKQQGMCDKSDNRIFGLLNGFEEELKSEFEGLNFYSEDKVNAVCDKLNPYYTNEKDISEMPPFSQFRLELEHESGIKHTEVIDILKYLYSKSAYQLEIDRLGNFKLNENDI
ncbi:hypothetical protein [Bacillus velezensis]|uniref:hypothetical protein n=1 Tax=Bacillus velezensis TaxID=492670 RepID=UPI003873756D